MITIDGKAFGVSEFKFTLNQVKEIAAFYILNRESISAAFACRHEVFDVQPGDSFPILRIIEDLDHIRRGEPCSEGLAFEQAESWIAELKPILFPKGHDDAR